jgi:D-alanyl-lipoteichoic acid acyltransferase DltB (MBOAT superfamily)
MTFWLIYIGVVIFHFSMGGRLNEILLGVAFNNVILLFAPLEYLKVPMLQEWVESNRMTLTVILSLILAYYILKLLHFLGDFYQK